MKVIPPPPYRSPGRLAKHKKTACIIAFGRLITASGRLITASGRFITASGRLVTASGRFIAVPELLITASGQFITASGRIITAPGSVRRQGQDLIFALTRHECTVCIYCRPRRRCTIEFHLKNSEAPHLRSPIPLPKTDLSKNQLASR